MEENYLIQSKIHTKAIVTIMEKVLKNKSADILDYYGLFSNWLSWFHLNDPMYENLSDPNKGEHLEVTLTRLRMSLPGFEVCAKALLKDVRSIISLYRSNPDNPDYWFKVSEDMYKGHCLTSVSSNYVESACMTEERIYEVLSKEIMDDSELKIVPEVETSSAIKVYLNGDVCQSFYRSGAVGHIFKNCNEELFYHEHRERSYTAHRDTLRQLLNDPLIVINRIQYENSERLIYYTDSTDVIKTAYFRKDGSIRITDDRE